MEVLLQGAQISFIFLLLLLQDTLIPISKGERKSVSSLPPFPPRFIHTGNSDSPESLLRRWKEGKPILFLIQCSCNRIINAAQFFEWERGRLWRMTALWHSCPPPLQRLTDVLAGGPHVDTEAPAKWQALPDWVSSPFYSWNVSEFLSVNKPCSKTS